MARLRVWTAAATFCITSIPLLFSACGLGSDMDVGDDRSPQSSTGGRSTGGSASSTGGLLGNGGFIGSGAARGSGGVQITIVEGGAGGAGNSPGVGGARASGGATGSGGGLPARKACGTKICGPDEDCCNPSCSTCVPTGGACDMKDCGDPQGGTLCGSRVCAPGVACCNPSCSVCTNDLCTQEVCEPPAPCKTDGDCRVEADYCKGCHCRALVTNEKMPPCDGPEFQCLVDPCDGKSAVCRGGQCVVP